jgi:DNA polymerase-3 subunit delta'
MPLLPLVGHHEARRRLSTAAADGRLPQVLLFTGAQGVGKQRLALWLAQLVLCTQPSAEPCGKCRQCLAVLELRHPDLHWLVPIPRPKAGDPGKQVEEAAESLAAVMDERRGAPLYGAPDGMASHGIASVRLLQRSASLTSVEGGRRVFIIGDAERLVPQESSPDAANAMLKLLEEPPSESVIMLTAVDARRLLPTVRSRAVPLRLQRLSAAEVRGFLREHAEVPAAELETKVVAADGSIGAAIGEDAAAGAARRGAESVLEAAVGPRGPRMQRALAQAPASARGEFAALLDAMNQVLAEAARSALGGERRRAIPAALEGRDPDALVRAMERVSAAREAAQGNVNPQLLLAVLGEELAETL